MLENAYNQQQRRLHCNLVIYYYWMLISTGTRIPNCWRSRRLSCFYCMTHTHKHTYTHCHHLPFQSIDMTKRTTIYVYTIWNSILIVFNLFLCSWLLLLMLLHQSVWCMHSSKFFFLPVNKIENFPTQKVRRISNCAHWCGEYLGKLYGNCPGKWS